MVEKISLALALEATRTASFTTVIRSWSQKVLLNRDVLTLSKESGVALLGCRSWGAVPRFSSNVTDP